MKHTFISLISLQLLVTASFAFELFREDFSDHQENSSIKSENGWFGGTNRDLPVNHSIHFQSRAANGDYQTPPQGDKLYLHRNRFLNSPLSSRQTYELSFRARSTIDSANSGLAFDGGTYGYAGWFATSGGGWSFDARFVTTDGGVTPIGNAPNTNVYLTSVIDPIAGEVYGIYDFGSGPQETQRFTLDPTKLDDILGVYMYQDFRSGSNGVTIDDIVVRSTRFVEDFETHPVPGTISQANGWYGGDVIVDDVTPLGSNAIDGFQLPAAGAKLYITLNRFANDSPLTMGSIYTLSYRVNNSQNSRNSGVYFEGGTYGYGGWIMSYNNANEWEFDSRWITTDGEVLSNVFQAQDQPIEFTVVIDAVFGEVYGTYDTGSGIQYTPVYTLDPSKLSDILGVKIFNDFRNGGTGIQIDDIEVTAE
ncbi:MAG: hypothetical protein AAGA96_08415 [Verrucomicrobiota bacterium]